MGLVRVTCRMIAGRDGLHGPTYAWPRASDEISPGWKRAETGFVDEERRSAVTSPRKSRVVNVGACELADAAREAWDCSSVSARTRP